MVHKVLFWGGFGVAVRIWQLGIEMRPFFARQALWAYPMYAGIGASFGYWLQGIEDRQMRILADTRSTLLEKRRRRAEREGLHAPTDSQKHQESLFASPLVQKQYGIDVPFGSTEKTNAAA